MTDYDSNKFDFCPRCGNKIENDMVFCGKCGLDLIKAATDYRSAAGINSSQPGQFAYVPQAMPMVDKSYATGDDAVSEYEQIDGVRADEMAIHIGSNGGKYVKKFFKQERNGKKLGFKWQALFFPQCWTAYRKMYLPMLVSLLVLIIAAIPLMLSFVSFGEIYYSEISQQIGDNQTLLGYMEILSSSFIPSAELIKQTQYVMLSWLVLITCQLFNGLYFALYGEHLYKKQVLSKIKKLKMRFNQPSLDNNEYRISLMQSGGANPFNVMGVLIIIYLLYYFGSYFMLNLLL